MIESIGWLGGRIGEATRRGGLWLLLWCWVPWAGAQSLLAPEEAFRLETRVLDAATVELVYRIAPGYYLYRDKFRFEPGDGRDWTAAPVLPAGEPIQDEFFGPMEIYRDEVRVRLHPAPDGRSTRLTLAATSQGCADIGVCYPPDRRELAVDLAQPGTVGGGFLAQALNGSRSAGTAVPAPVPAGVAAAGDESSQIARLLHDARGPWVLASFFGFGLLLAFTPCTFPMIPILSGIIVGQGAGLSRGRALCFSLAYVLGMALTYAVAGVAAGLTGTLLAAVLQNVWVLGFFALVFVVLALAMFGFFELQLPSALQSRLADDTRQFSGRGLFGVAAMGAVSALIVGPCVAAPLAGALLYIAQTGDAGFGGTALFVMALGMGAPLLVVGVAARSVLPRVGPWMEGVKKAFGVIMLALALWFLMPVLPVLASMLGWGALLVFSGIYLHALDSLPPHARPWQRFWKGCGVLLLLAGASILIGAAAGSRDPLQPLAIFQNARSAAPSPGFEPVGSLAELERRLAAADRPVMLDFYADWCVSCKEMERFTFADPAVSARMARMILLKADVTANREDDKALLQRFGLFGPPGIVFFAPGGQEMAAQRVVGYMPAQDFAARLDRVLQP